MECQIAAQLSCPSCNSSRNTGWHWKTGHWRLKMDTSPPTVIVSCPSHPFFPLTHSCFTQAAQQLVAGNVHVAEVRVVWNHNELWEIPGGMFWKWCEAVDGQAYLSAIKIKKINEHSPFVSLSVWFKKEILEISNMINDHRWWSSCTCSGSDLCWCSL